MSIAEKLQQMEKERHQAKISAKLPEQGKTSTPDAAADGENERKARTRRLIQLGALSDQYLETGNCSPKAFEELLQELVQLHEVQTLLGQRRGK